MVAFLQAAAAAKTLRQVQFRNGRRASPTGAIAIHTAEIAPDTVGVDGAAEKIARIIRDRADHGSYHRIVDSDSIVELIDFENEAFHDGTGGNRWSIGLSVATQAHMWHRTPKAWRRAAITNLARAAAEANDWLIANGHPPCPPRLINRTEYRAGGAGFIAHGTIDPTRRTDPGRTFPWGDFLAEYKQLTTVEPTPTINEVSEEDEEMLTAVKTAYDIGNNNRTETRVVSVTEHFEWLDHIRDEITKGGDPAQVIDTVTLYIADTVANGG